MKKEVYNRYIYIIILLLFCVISYKIIQPFVTSLITSMILAYVFYPIYRKTKKKTKNKLLSASFIIAIIFLMISVPAAFILNSLYYEVVSTVDSTRNKISELGNTDSQSTGIRGAINSVQEKLGITNIDQKISEAILDAANIISNWSYKLIVALSTSIIDIFIVLFMTFFFLIDGRRFVSYSKKVLPLKEKHQKNFTTTVQNTIKGVIYGVLIVALAQGVLAGIGYWIISSFGGISNPILWAMLTTFAATIPTMGTGIIWLPMSLYLIGMGIAFNNLQMLIMGVSLIIYGTIVISTVDNLIRPKIIGEKANLHPIIVFIGILGGIQVFGIVGIVIGPVILAIMQAILKLHKERKLL